MIPRSTTGLGGVLIAAGVLALRGVQFASGAKPSDPALWGELPVSHIRAAFFIAGSGRMWLASTGLYTAASLRGDWRLGLDARRHGLDSKRLSIGTKMAFVSDDVVIVAPGDEIIGDTVLRTFRTIDAGRTWTIESYPRLHEINALSANGRSVWLFGAKWGSKDLEAVFLRSRDGGATWAPSKLPAGFEMMVSVLYRPSASVGYVAMWSRVRSAEMWRTTDGGDSWHVVPTPADQGLEEIRHGYQRVSEIATVGPWLVVREYGHVFATRADEIKWRRLPGLDHIAADLESGTLFFITDSLRFGMLDRDLVTLWSSRERIWAPGRGGFESVHASRGKGFVLDGMGIYEAGRDAPALVYPTGSAFAPRPHAVQLVGHRMWGRSGGDFRCSDDRGATWRRVAALPLGETQSIVLDSSVAFVTAGAQLFRVDLRSGSVRPQERASRAAGRYDRRAAEMAEAGGALGVISSTFPFVSQDLPDSVDYLTVSVDGGKNWHRLLESPGGLAAITPLGRDFLVVGFDGALSRIKRTASGMSVSWQGKLASPRWSALGVRAIVADSTGIIHVWPPWVSDQPRYPALRSRDGGRSWAAAPDAPEELTKAVPFRDGLLFSVGLSVYFLRGDSKVKVLDRTSSPSLGTIQALSVSEDGRVLLSFIVETPLHEEGPYMPHTGDEQGARRWEVYEYLVSEQRLVQASW